MVESLAVFAVFAVVSVAVVGVAIWSRAVPLSRRTVLAAAPWTVVGATTVVAGRAGVYDGTAVTTPLVVATLGVVAAASWVLFARLAALRGIGHRERYLTASGLGVASIVLPTLFAHAGNPAWVRVVWLAVAPVLAGVVAAGAYFVLGLLYTDAVVAFRIAGLYVVWSIVFDGVASATALEVLGGEELGVVTLGITSAVEAAGVSVSPWLLLPVHALVGVVYVGCCGWLARQYGPAGNGFVLLASALWLGSGTVVLLSATLLG